MVRCADSLPAEAVIRLAEIERTLAAIDANSPLFLEFQRRQFRTLEKYLDAGSGECALRKPAIARMIVEELNALDDWQVSVPHFTVMPNHWHALVVPREACSRSLAGIMKRVKGRSGRRIRATIGGRGPFWQREWFDRWMRDDAEWEKCVDYIRNNPVKAGLAKSWNGHP